MEIKFIAGELNSEKCIEMTGKQIHTTRKIAGKKHTYQRDRNSFQITNLSTTMLHSRVLLVSTNHQTLVARFTLPRSIVREENIILSQRTKDQST